MESFFKTKKVEITFCFTLIHFFYKLRDINTNKEIIISYVPEKPWGYIPCFFLKSKIIKRLNVNHHIELYKYTVENYNPITKYERYNILFSIPFFNISNCIGYCLLTFINN